MRFAFPYGVDGDGYTKSATCSAVVLLGSAGEGIVIRRNLLLARKAQEGDNNNDK
jgi:hypothetical protein